MPKITTLLFDCDNTLVLSEIHAFNGCAELANELLKKHGIRKQYTGPELMNTFVGQNFRGMMTSLEKVHNFKIEPKEFDEYVDRELEVCIKNLRAAAVECPGATDVVQRYHKEGKYKMAIVSSSAMSRVVASVEKVKQDSYFGGADIGIFSAATSINPPTSKPNPAIYLHACKELGVKPEECLAIEDSRSGATAAKNAKINLLGYVGPYEEEGPEKMKQMEKVLGEECGALKLMYHWNEFDKILAEIQKMPSKDTGSRI